MCIARQKRSESQNVHDASTTPAPRAHEEPKCIKNFTRLRGILCGSNLALTMFPDFAIDADRPINERIEEMDTKEEKRPCNIGDFVIKHADNGGVTVRRFYRRASNGGAESFEAAHTTPAEMLAWLAEQYGAEIKPRETVLHISAGQLNAQGGEHLLKGLTFDKVRVDEDVTVKLRPLYGASPLAEAPVEDGAPRYVWKTREDFVAALTMALTVVRNFRHAAPADHARKLADIIDSVHAQGIG